MKQKKQLHKMQGVNGHKEVQVYINECSMQKVLSMLVLYRERNNGEYESFEDFIEQVLIGIYGAQQYKSLLDQYRKKIKKEDKK